MWRFLLLLLAGCASTERGECLDWDIKQEIWEKCIPFYGQLICSEEVRHTYKCVLREEKPNESVREHP